MVLLIAKSQGSGMDFLPRVPHPRTSLLHLSDTLKPRSEELKACHVFIISRSFSGRAPTTPVQAEWTLMGSAKQRLLQHCWPVMGLVTVTLNQPYA